MFVCVLTSLPRDADGCYVARDLLVGLNIYYMCYSTCS